MLVYVSLIVWFVILSGCDRSKYEMKGRILRIENDKKVKEVARKLKEAKSRMEQMKMDDGEQAKGFYRSMIFFFSTCLAST